MYFHSFFKCTSLIQFYLMTMWGKKKKYFENKGKKCERVKVMNQNLLRKINIHLKSYF